MSVMRMTLPPRWAGGVRVITPSGTGSCIPLFDAGADSVVHNPTRTGSPGATSAFGSSISEMMHDRPASFTPVTIRRTFPDMMVPLRHLRDHATQEPFVYYHAWRVGDVVIMLRTIVHPL